MGGMIWNLEGEGVDTPLRTLIQLESRETYISPLEICKKNAIKKISGLKYLMKLFQNQKLESKLNDF